MKIIQKATILASKIAVFAAVLMSWEVGFAQSAPSASPTPSPPSWPGMSGPLAVNPKPMNFKAGPLGRVYFTGAASGFGQWQNNVFPGDRGTQIDVSNAHIFFNKTDGLLQFFVHAGAYSIPDIGVPYIRAIDATNDFFGPLPQAFIKLAPTETFSIMAGKLPTLIGAEYTFSFENMNIERGLLWNQENAVNRGVQANYSAGPVALAASWNDGFYSNRFSWAVLSATWKIDANTLAFVGGGNTSRTHFASTATPLFQNNQQIYNLIYTHKSGQWTVQPYVQITHVPRIPKIGALHDAATYGAALLANYTFQSRGFSLPFRLEYIATTGNLANGAPNLLYGPGSKAWSATLTPTYQRKIFFARGEFSFVGAMDTTPGMAFGPNGVNTSQTRLLIEAGVLF